MSRSDAIDATVKDLADKFLWHDRKEDEILPRGAIEEAIKAGEISEARIVELFAAELHVRLGWPTD